MRYERDAITILVYARNSIVTWHRPDATFGLIRNENDSVWFCVNAKSVSESFGIQSVWMRGGIIRTERVVERRNESEIYGFKRNRFSFRNLQQGGWNFYDHHLRLINFTKILHFAKFSTTFRTFHIFLLLVLQQSLNCKNRTIFAVSISMRQKRK